MENEVKIETQVELEEVFEADASLNLNKEYTHKVKFTFTDASINANKQRVPKSEFSNIVKTGVGMPIKLASLDNMVHKNSGPIGVITHLKETEDSVVGLGVLWKAEREEDVATIKLLKDSGAKVNLSWELGYFESQIIDEIEELHDVVVKATTIVRDPAYEGRTQIEAIAEVDYKAKYEELLAKYEALLQKEDEMDTEMSSLKSFKDEEEKKKEKKRKLDEIKNKYKSAGIDKDEVYFEENEEKLLGMSESDLDFHLNEMISFAQASVSKIRIPDIQPTRNKSSLKELGEELRNNYKRGN